METLGLRPHHILDIVTDFQRDEDPQYQRQPGENNVRTLTRMMGTGLDIAVELVIGPDFVCTPCSHLRPDGSCDRILEAHSPPEPRDQYNNALDRRILGYLGIPPGTAITVHRFLTIVNDRIPGIEEVCTHPTQRRADRLRGLIRGLAELGIRPAEGP